MTPNEVQAIKSAVEHLTSEFKELKDQAKESAEKVDTRMTSLEQWRERMKGAGVVFVLAAPTISGLVVAFLTKK